MPETHRNGVHYRHGGAGEDAAPGRMTGERPRVTIRRGFTDKRLIVSECGKGEACREGQTRITVVTFGCLRHTRHAIHAGWGINPHHRRARGVGDPRVECLLDVGATQIHKGIG